MPRRFLPFLTRFSLTPYKVARSSVALVLIGALFCSLFSGCFSSKLLAKHTAAVVVEQLESITDLKQRELAAVYTLNTLCTLSRLAAGKADGRVETKVAPFFASKVPKLDQLRLLTIPDALDAIPAAKRTQLLGAFAGFDPGKCTSAPKWDEIKHAVILKTNAVPRLRTQYCSGNFTYADGEKADRSITAASSFVDHFDGTGALFSAASPVILGMEGKHVTAGDPALQATAGNDGISPFGVATNIACSPTNDSCDAAQGLICGAKVGGPPSRCVAFPVVQKDEELILRGYNFWDVESARLVFSPLLPGSGTESNAQIESVEANEPTDGTAACPLPSLTNPTHNRAHFKVSANENRFYRLQMYNHNGTFLTQRDAIDNEPPRPIHICYPEAVNAQNVPPDTVRNCTLPVEPCSEDGKPCSATWSKPPRKLQDCKHLPGQPAPCGETPEWFRNESLSVRQGPEGIITTDPIVFVSNGEPKYEIRGSLAAIECVDETNEWGSDEPLVYIGGIKVPPNNPDELLKNADKLVTRWRGTKFDSGERRQVDKLLLTVPDVRAGDKVMFTVALMEDDGDLDAFFGGLAVIGVAVAIAALAGAASGPIGVVAGLATAFWGAYSYYKLGPDDPLGRTTLLATTVDFDERIGATHTNDFLTAGTTLGALPAAPEPYDFTEKQRANPHLIHPFVDFPLKSPLKAQCDPGPCGAGETCLVNQCVPAGFVDPTNGRGFRERREFADSDAYYVLDLLWEKVRVP